LIFVVLTGTFVLFTTACLQSVPETSAPVTPEPSVPLSQTPLPLALFDASPVFAGICFASANDAAGRVFLLRSQADLNALFDGSDNSRFCDRPVERRPFDFAKTDGVPTRAIIGTWSRGQGCTARHEVISVTIDEAARILQIRVRFIISGACPYELVRPLWLGVPEASHYLDIQLSVDEVVVQR
jgi:hypothetical protein